MSAFDAGSALESWFSASPDALWVVDSHFELRLFNSAFAGLLRSSVGVEVKEGPFLDALPESVATPLRGALTLAMQGEPAPMVWRLPGHSIRVQVTPLRDPNGVVGATLRGLPAKDAQSEFLAQISHELRTPLNAIVGLTDLVLEQALAPETLPLVQKVHANSQSLLHLVTDVLDFSEMESGRLALAPEPCDVGALVESVVRFYQPRAGEAGLGLEFDLRPGVPSTCRVDPKRLRQVVHHLLSNALKYTSRGVVAVSLKGVSDDPMWLELAVKDTGIGIPVRDQELIFTRFFRSYRTVDTRQTGTGLGLAITKAAVTLLGGEIRLRSAPGEGSTFRVRFPVGPVEVSVPTPLETTALRRSVQVLVADDMPDNRRVISGILTGRGDQVTEVADGAAAIDAVMEKDFDLVVMDVDMEPMDGVRATIEIRAREGLLGLERLPIVALTAHTVPEVRQRCEESGMDGFLTKPVDAAQLVQAVDARVDRRPQVLVVDDSPTSRRILERTVEAAGGVVVSAGSAQEAMAVSTGHTLHAALLDHELPDIPGPELARRLRSSGFGGPIVVVTGHAMGDVKERWADVGVSSVLEKPLSVEGIVHALGVAMQPPKKTRELDPDLADLVPMYLEDRREDLQRLRAALAKGDVATVRKVAHRIKGTGTSYGYPELTELGGALEDAARAGETDGMEAMVEAMAQVLES